MNQEIAEYHFKKIDFINKSNNSLEEKFILFNRLFEQMLNALTMDIDVHFSSQFSKMAYAFQEKKPGIALRRQIHRLWKEKNNTDPKTEADIQNYTQVLALSASHFFEEDIPDALLKEYPFISSIAEEWAKEPELEKLDFIKVSVTHVNTKKGYFMALTEEEGAVIKIDYSKAEISGYFQTTIKFILRSLKTPFQLQLINSRYEDEDLLYPEAFVVEPDYLFDVTAIAECFKPEQNNHFFHLLKKLKVFESNVNLVIGNTANFFLDELMSHPKLNYRDAMIQLFQRNPLPFCALSDAESSQLFTKSKIHFQRLKQIVSTNFNNIGLDASNSQLEPTFYSEKYGLQGRLDVFHKSEENAAIIELKSGKTFKPNGYKINSSHYIQTLLYDLLIRSTFGSETDPKNYVLYSGESENNLRFAPAVPSIQYEALQMRNLLYGIERLLADSPARDILNSKAAMLVNRLQTKSFPEIKGGFLFRDLKQFADGFANSSLLEKKYFLAFCGFIARENIRAKMGIADSDKNKGQARLWLLGEAEKNNNFLLLKKLQLRQVDNEGNNTVLHFDRTEDTHVLANFRQGDIVVLYPNEKAPTEQQLFKASLTSIDTEKISVKLRNKQHNKELFEQTKYWNAEHDHIDSGFNQMFGALSGLLTSPKEIKDRLLGNKAPEAKSVSDLNIVYPLSDEQKELMKKMLSKQDYFLLWGPPGTGKTSRMLRYFVQWCLENTDDKILLLSYTNRAVDEICSAVFEIGEYAQEHTMRIGSTTSAAVIFHQNFMAQKVKGLDSREKVMEKIQDQRVVVATVSSLLGNQEILQLLNFDRVLIDEASQIPEPMLIGLLAKLKHPILIGDHKQLPAVVVQDKAQSEVHDQELHEIGLLDMRNSYFERKYKLAVNNGWDHVFGQLSFQGRMHQDIMNFPARYYYQDHLHILSEQIDPQQRQKRELEWVCTTGSSELTQVLSENRLAFFPCPINEKDPWAKLNENEAEKVATIVDELYKMYALHGRDIHEESIGIITPFRAQIAQIRKCLKEKNIDEKQITIDTVERYQGGARDIIILSVCANNSKQMEAVCSLSDEGIDRKLNVAITRAREQFFIVGNQKLMNESSSYSQLLGYIDSLKTEEAMEY